MELLQQRISRLELEANLEVIDEKTLKLKCAISGDPNLFKEKLTANKTIGFSETRKQQCFSLDVQKKGPTWTGQWIWDLVQHLLEVYSVGVS